ncbi:MAG: hypothetical protein V4538_01480 [Bacteroidota bacterium]
MKKIITIIGLMLIGSAYTKAQTVVVEETVTRDTVNTNKQNKVSLGLMLDFTFYGGANEKGLEGTLANSLGVNTAINLKYKLHKNLKLVSQFGINVENYAFKKTDTNTSFPSTLNNSVDRFMVTALSLSLGARVSLGKGFYAEAGAMAKWNFANAYNYETKDANGNNVEVFVRDLNYIKNFNYDAYARIGYEVINIVAYYRLNDMFQTTSIAPVVYEVPRLRLGISIGM